MLDWRIATCNQPNYELPARGARQSGEWRSYQHSYFGANGRSIVREYYLTIFGYIP